MKPVAIEIGTTTFYIKPFDPFRQLEMFADLQQEVLPAVGGVLVQAFSGGDEAAKDEAAGMAAFHALSMKLGSVTVKKWCDRMFDGEYVTFEREGAPAQKMSPKRADAFDDYTQILELLYHIGRINFAGPLARSPTLTGLGQRMRAKLSESLTTS